MMKEEQNTSLIREMAKELGRLGGKATSSKYGSNHFRELQKKATEAKRLKKQNS